MWKDGRFHSLLVHEDLRTLLNFLLRLLLLSLQTDQGPYAPQGSTSLLPKWSVTSKVSFCLLVGCLTSQQHASVSQGRVCSDNCTCCHTEIEVADQTFHFTQSQYTDTGPTSPSTDPITPGAWQGSHWYQCLSHWYDSTPKKSRLKQDSNLGPSALEADALTTRPTRRFRK